METGQITAYKHGFFKDMLRFMHYLRAEGFALTSGEVIAAFRALERLHLSDETEIFLGMRTVLCSTRKERVRFQRLFTAFFYDSQKDSEWEETVNGTHINQEGQAKQNMNETAENVIKTDTDRKESPEQIGENNSSEGGGEKENTTFLQAVRQSQTASKQLTTIPVPNDHYADMLKVARSLIRRVRLRPSRRWKPKHNGNRIDLRRTFRRSLNTGGYAVDPARSSLTKNKARFVLLCDGSRSMAAYTELFLQFAAALYRETAQMELYLFSTEIRRVTHLLKKAYPPYMPYFTKLGSEWGGGTRIGSALTRVIREERSQLLSKQTIFIIFSDGLESGDLIELEQGMHMLKEQVNCVIWLNPLLGKSGYKPLARGMNLALQYIDIFAEAHEVASFHKLAQHMNKLPKFR